MMTPGDLRRARGLRRRREYVPVEFLRDVGVRHDSVVVLDVALGLVEQLSVTMELVGEQRLARAC
jgi:hypothetical protein